MLEYLPDTIEDNSDAEEPGDGGDTLIAEVYIIEGNTNFFYKTYTTKYLSDYRNRI